MITKERQSDSVGYIYKTTHVPSGRFYIGESTVLDEKKMSKYFGSGAIMKKMLKSHPREEFKREILYWGSDYNELYRLEIDTIKKFISHEKNLNIRTHVQGEATPCKECGKIFTHSTRCKNCRGCKECGGKLYSHRKGCSKFVPSASCKECGARANHKKECSKFIPTPPCKECGGGAGLHKKECSKFIPTPPCKECGGRSHNHTKLCSRYVPPNECTYCGSKGAHARNRPSYSPRKKCDICGNSGPHALNCPHRKETLSCSECGGKLGKHYSNCSKFRKKTCDECGGGSGNHRPECSKFVQRIRKCEECGNKTTHKKTCSKYKLKSKGELNNV